MSRNNICFILYTYKTVLVGLEITWTNNVEFLELILDIYYERF